ncbi:MAG: hypothetical protein ACHQ0J_08185 [Candidatus Dormibacterales bacterium]
MNRLRKSLGWALPALALVMLTLTLIPADAWRHPAVDALYTGFDPNLVSTSVGGKGAVQVYASSLNVTAPQGSLDSATLVTTPLRTLRAAVDVTVLDDGGSFRIGVWSPWTGSGQFVVFGSAPEHQITAYAIDKGTAGPTLVGGSVVDAKVLGTYQTHHTYHLAVLADRANGVITSTVTGDDGTNGQASATPGQLNALFGNVQLSLTASALGSAGTSQVVLQNYSLTLPHQRSWASRIDDPTARFLLTALAVLGALAIVLAIVINAPWRAFSAWSGSPRRRPAISRGPRALAIGVGAIVVYLAGNALLFPLGSHPFDMGGAKLWAYVARVYGIAQLYYLPNLVSVTSTWRGVPYIESAFPYEPVSAYLSAAIGWVNSLLFAGGAVFSTTSLQLEYLIKTVNVLFGLADAALIYFILKQLGASERWRLTASALFLFNPAVWFNMSVWGQTHVFSLFFVLAAILLLERQRPTFAWMALAAGVLTRPQMVVFGVLLGIVLLRRFTWRQNVAALSWTVIVAFLALVPFTLATSPSLPVDIMLHNLGVQEAGGNEAALTTVSQGGLSIWPMVTYLAHGASSLQRAFTPTSEVVFGSLTYQTLSQVLTVAAMLIVAGLLLFRKRSSLDDGGYLPLVALGITSFLMLLTGILATHFVLALPFLLLCRRWMGGVAYYYIAAIWTVTTFIPMYGDMGVLISSLDYPLSHSPITSFVVHFYASDRFITVAVIANVCAVLWLAYVTYRYFTAPRTSLATQS